MFLSLKCLLWPGGFNWIGFFRVIAYPETVWPCNEAVSDKDQEAGQRRRRMLGWPNQRFSHWHSKQKPSGLQAPGPAILMWWIQIQNTIFLIPEYILLNIIYEKLYCCPVKCIQWGFPGGSVVKNMPSKQERQVQSLGLGRPLRKEMATHSSIHTWEIPWKEEQGRLQSWSHKIVRHNLATKQQQQSTYNS